MSALQRSPHLSSIWSRLLPLACLLLLLSLSMPLRSYSQENDNPPQEYGLKAVYLYNFLQFVHWPVDRCLLADGKVKEIAVIGSSPIGKSLQALKAELKKTQGTEITVRFLGPYDDAMDLSGCRLLFITKTEMKNIKKILAKIKGQPVLTVADTEECLEQGCMIALLSRMNKIRWAVNRTPAKEAGLSFNSRLLAMAVKIIEKKYE